MTEPEQPEFDPGYVHPFPKKGNRTVRVQFDLAVKAMRNALQPGADPDCEDTLNALVTALAIVCRDLTASTATVDDVRNMVVTAIEQRRLALQEAAKSIVYGETIRDIAQHPEVLHLAAVRDCSPAIAAQAAAGEFLRLLQRAVCGAIIITMDGQPWEQPLEGFGEDLYDPEEGRA